MLNPADQKAFAKVTQCRPQWQGMCEVRSVLIDDEKRLLHAGPPFEQVAHIPAPVMNSLCVGAVYEGWANDIHSAREMILAGTIRVEPAQDHNIVVPLAGVVSPSMQLMVIGDANNPQVHKYSVLNEGMVHCTRLGTLDPELQNHLRWLNGELTDWIKQHLGAPIDLLPIIAEALAQGDDCHGRTIVGSALFAEKLMTGVADVPEPIAQFLDGALAFALNIWMAASSLMMSCAEGEEGSSLVTKAAGNGYQFGVQVAAKPGQWFTMSAPEVKGAIEPIYAGKTAVGAIGDSAVVDFMGLGGQVLKTATVSHNNLKAFLPEDALQRPEKALAGVIDGFDGRLGVTCARNVVTNQGGPLVLLGMIEDRGEAGRIGGGVVDVPVAFFQEVINEAGL